MGPAEIRSEQCDAARHIEDEYGTDKALAYLIGEKFLNFVEAAETRSDFREELPAFVKEIRTIFEPWQLTQYLTKARQTDPRDDSLVELDEDSEDLEMERLHEIQGAANDLLLVEKARAWLLGEE